ncbi:hypothetical protein PQX77_005898, partial [Marasmius sp. AFHP31]
MRSSTARWTTVALLCASRLAKTLAATVTPSNPSWPYGHQLFREESLLYETNGLAGFTTKCALSGSTTVAAQWIRT